MKLLIAFLLTCTFSHAQVVPPTATISGRLSECATNEDIFGASVLAFDGKGKAVVLDKQNGKPSPVLITNAAGGYTVTVPTGVVTLHFNRLGYTAPWHYDTGARTMTRVLSLAPGETLKLDLCMDAQGR